MKRAGSSVRLGSSLPPVRKPFVSTPPPTPLPEPDPARTPGTVKRVLLVAVGLLALGLGILGVVLPVLPTAPLILAASACFAGAWPRMHDRLGQSRLFGPMIRAGPGGRFLPRRTKIGVIGFLWVSIGATTVFAVEALWLRLLLVAIALTVTTVLLRMPSGPRDAAP